MVKYYIRVSCWREFVRISGGRVILKLIIALKTGLE